MRIHFVSNSLAGLNSGYSSVVKNLATELNKLGHDCVVSGTDMAYVPRYHYGILNYPLNTRFLHPAEQLYKNILDHESELVIYLFQVDDPNLYPLLNIPQQKIWYVPIESSGLRRHMVDQLRSVSDIIAVTNYGRNEIINAGLDMNIPVIYHGYNQEKIKYVNLSSDNSIDKNTKYCMFNTEYYYDQADKKFVIENKCYDCNLCNKFREETVNVLMDRNGYHGSFTTTINKFVHIVKNDVNVSFNLGFVGQNFGVRKRIERLLEAFSIFVNHLDANERKDVILHLHTLPITNAGIDLLDVINELDKSAEVPIRDKIIFTFGNTRSSTWSEEALNILYNLFDIGISASSAEGFCIPVMETFAVGKPFIAPDFSSFTELIKGDKVPRGLLAEIVTKQRNMNGMTRALVDTESLADMMLIYYHDRKLLKKHGRSAIKFAKDFTYDKIVKEFDKIIENYEN